MDSKHVSMLSLSKAIIADYDRDRFCVLDATRTGHPLRKPYLALAFVKMERIASCEAELAATRGILSPIRLRLIEIEDQSGFSATLHVDLIVDDALASGEVDALTALVTEALQSALGTDQPDDLGALCRLKLATRCDTGKGGQAHPDGDEFYAPYL